jgi:hypothetical protein
MGSYTGTLPTLAAADVITDSALIGQILPALNALVDSGTPYTPGWFAATTNPTLGDGTIEGAYRRTGKWGDAAFRITVGSTTTFGTGSYEFELPSGWSLPAGAWNNNQGIGVFFDNSAGTYYVGSLGAVASNANRFRLRPHSQGNLTGTSLFTLQPFDQICARITTELS